MGIHSTEDNRDEYTSENHKARLEAKEDLKNGENIYSIDDLEKEFTT